MDVIGQLGQFNHVITTLINAHHGRSFADCALLVAGVGLSSVFTYRGKLSIFEAGSMHLYCLTHSYRVRRNQS